MLDSQLIGIDIGGTKITAGLVEKGVVINSGVVNTESDKSKEAILENLFGLIEDIITPSTVAIGVGVPGIINNKDGIINELNNIPEWKNLQLKNILEDKFGRMILVDNDANCFVLGNKYFGEAEAYKNIVGITLGTGVGAGIIVNNSLYNGIENGAGEFGQIPYKDSIFETYCCGKFFSEVKKLNGEELYELAKQGDLSARDAWEELGNHIAELVRIVLFSFAPELIVFGGSVSKGFNFFMPSVIKMLSEMTLRRVAEQLKIIRDVNRQSPVLGAAALYLNQ